MQNSIYNTPAARPMSRLYHWAYGLKSQLALLQEGQVCEWIASEQGVRQGDVLGSLAFANSMHQAYSMCASENVTPIAVADDLRLVGRARDTWESYKIFEAYCHDKSIPLAPDKCEILWPHSCPPPQWLVEQTAERNMKLICNSVSVAFGAPIGLNHEHAKVWCLDRVHRENESLKALNRLPSQNAMLLLRNSHLSSLSFLARSLTPEITYPASLVFDEATMNSLHVILGTDQPIPAEAQKQASLPTRLGGLGLIEQRTRIHASFYAAAVAATPFTNGVLSGLGRSTNYVNALAASHAHLLASGVRPTDGLFASTFVDHRSLSSAHVAPGTKVQKMLSKMIDEQCLNNLQDSLRTLKDQRRFRAIAQNGVAAWLHAIPSDEDLTLRDVDMKTALRLWLGMSVVNFTLSQCPCGADLRENFCHAHSCVHTRGRSVRGRHDDLVKLLARFIRALDGSVTVEDYDAQRNHSARPDLTARLMHRRAFVDLSITHPLANTYLRRNANFSSAILREREKINKYAPMAAIEGTPFYPFVMETFGYIPQKSLQLLTKFILPIRERYDSNPLSISEMLQKLSVCLQRGNARVALQGVNFALGGLN
jgi:hypothetical protein